MGITPFELYALPLLSFFYLYHAACEILVPQPGIEPVPPAVEAQSQQLHLQGSPLFEPDNKPVGLL